MLDDDYKLAGFRLLPTGKRDLGSAIVTFISTVIMLPVSLLPSIYGYGGNWVFGVSLVCSLVFLYLGFMLLIKRDIKSAQRLMFGSFFYLPIVQLMFLFDFLGK